VKFARLNVIIKKKIIWHVHLSAIYLSTIYYILKVSFNINFGVNFDKLISLKIEMYRFQND
jgi:hypothetical protein